MLRIVLWRKMIDDQGREYTLMQGSDIFTVNLPKAGEWISRLQIIGDGEMEPLLDLPLDYTGVLIADYVSGRNANGQPIVTGLRDSRLSEHSATEHDPGSTPAEPGTTQSASVNRRNDQEGNENGQ